MQSLFDKLGDLVSANTGLITTTTGLSVATGVAGATGNAPPGVDPIMFWIIGTFIAPIVTTGGAAMLRVVRARRRGRLVARQEWKEREGRRLLADGDPKNDAEARGLLEGAAMDREEVAAIDAEIGKERAR